MRYLKWRLLKLLIQNWLRDFAGSFIFYTTLPCLPFIKPEFNRIARFSPLVGILLGLIQSIVWILLSKIGWPKEGIALFVIAIGISITGGLHLDGLIDTADGIGAGHSRQLEAMKDSRVGAIGVQAIIIILLIQISSLIRLDSYAPVAMPIALFWGRCSQFWAINNFPYIHKNGASSFHKNNWIGAKEILPALITFILIICIVSSGLIIADSKSISILLLSIGILPAITIPQLIGKKIGGHCGDSYGASIVIVETIVLFFFALFLSY